jgi:hypothetical protein
MDNGRQQVDPSTEMIHLGNNTSMHASAKRDPFVGRFGACRGYGGA